MAEPLELSMAPGGGELLLRDAEEAYLLESPTTVSGTQDAGVISGATFSTPTMAFELEVLGGAATAQIEATITEVDPGTSTGTVDPDGNVTLSTSVTLDLHIEALGLVGDCRSTPIVLELISVAPYDPGTESVTLRDANFEIPELPVTSTCSDTFTGQANPMLAGPGHAVTLAFEGAITVPDPCDIDSTTSLEVTPDGGAPLGEEVALTATIDPDGPGATEPVTGVVEFRSGTKVLGQETVTAGTASLTTSAIPLGDHDLTADYKGDSVYCPSSDVAEYTITASPVFDLTLPETVVIGAAPTALPVTLENPTVGIPVTNARVDITIERVGPGGSSSDVLVPDNVVLEREGPSGVWTPVLLDSVPKPEPSMAQAVTGTIGATTGRPLAPGASIGDNLRISFVPNGDPFFVPGPLTVTFDAVPVDPTTGDEEGDPVASSSGRMVIRDATRAATVTTFEMSAPPWTRYGGMLLTDVSTGRVGGAMTTGTYHPSGPVRLLIDGAPVPYWASSLGVAAAPQLEVPYGPAGSNLNTYMTLPAGVGVGTHTLTAQFLGDDLFAPSSVSRTFTVHPPLGTPYACVNADPGFPKKYIVYAEAEGRMPAAATPGAPVSIADFDLSLKVGRSFSEYYDFFLVVQGGSFERVEIDLGEHGEGSAPAATQDAAGVNAWFGPPDDFPVDWELTMDGEEGSVTLPAVPGEVVTTAIEGFSVLYSGGVDIVCEAAGDPIVLGETVVAGTTLSVDGPAVPRADDEVTLRAEVAPSWATGVVEFYDGSDLVSIAAIDDGVAEISATLPEGTRSLTARTRAGASAPSSTSAPVTVEIAPAVECAAFAEEGNGAVVRLVYMELLGRCPDAAGFDYWVGRLDGGTSPEVFARTIARTPEAVGRVVDDAYRTMLGRSADASGRAFWTGRLLAHGRYDTLLADLGASEEFWSQSSSSNTGFVTRVYEQLLNRAPEQAGQDYWVGRLDAGTSRRALIISLSNQDEPLRVLVTDSFDEILSRTPPSSELSDGVVFLRSTGDRSGLYAQLIGTDEFFDRAQDFPNPED